MPNRSSKRLFDPNEMARSVVDQLTGDPDASIKSQAAKMLGRLGGLRGGPARAEALSKGRRSEIAKKAAKARWKGHKKKAAH
jgi:hypothetical protein